MTELSFELRPARREDRAQILALAPATLAEFDFTFGTGSASDAQLEGAPESFAPGALLEAVRGETLLGMAGLFPVGGDDWELRKMFLAPAARGQGLGQSLLDGCIELAREKNTKRIVLDTVDAMQRAIALHERNGFVRDDSQMRASRCSRGYRLDLLR